MQNVNATQAAVVMQTYANTCNGHSANYVDALTAEEFAAHVMHMSSVVLDEQDDSVHGYMHGDMCVGWWDEGWNMGWIKDGYKL